MTEENDRSGAPAWFHQLNVGDEGATLNDPHKGHYLSQRQNPVLGRSEAVGRLRVPSLVSSPRA